MGRGHARSVYVSAIRQWIRVRVVWLTNDSAEIIPKTTYVRGPTHADRRAPIINNVVQRHRTFWRVVRICAVVCLVSIVLVLLLPASFGSFTSTDGPVTVFRSLQGLRMLALSILAAFFAVVRHLGYLIWFLFPTSLVPLKLEPYTSRPLLSLIC
jgi:hypothetical protein